MLAQKHSVGVGDVPDPDKEQQVAQFRLDMDDFLADWAEVPETLWTDQGRKQLLLRRSALRIRAEQLGLIFGLERVRGNMRYQESKKTEPKQRKEAK